MEEVVVEVRVRASCKRFAIKDNGTCDRSARGFDGHNAKLHSFFSLRTMRVVTRTSAKLSRVPSVHLPGEEKGLHLPAQPGWMPKSIWWGFGPLAQSLLGPLASRTP